MLALRYLEDVRSLSMLASRWTVGGGNFTQSILNFTGSGVEAGQTDAVVMFFDEAHANLGDTMNIFGTLTTPYNFPTFVADGLKTCSTSRMTCGVSA